MSEPAALKALISLNL